VLINNAGIAYRAAADACQRCWLYHQRLVEPGFINSSSFQNTHYTSQAQQSEADPEDPYHCHCRNMGPFIERKMALSLATPEKVARRSLPGIKTWGPDR
jgi:hypothetical protein